MTDQTQPMQQQETVITPPPAAVMEPQAGGFQIILDDAPAAPAPAVTTGTTPVAAAEAGGLSFATATPEEKVKMEEVIKGIDLANGETVVTLGLKEREKLADLADQILDSVDPSVKLAFAEALRLLIDAIKKNSLEEIRKRIKGNSVQTIGKSLLNQFKGKDPAIEASKETIANFMTDITETRKTISEMVDALQGQQVTLAKNFHNINTLGYAVTETAKDMRIVRAATAEFIRRVDAGEVTTLIDLEKKVQTSGRSDDNEALMAAQANWNLIRTVDGDLLASVNVYDMNIAQLAFTKQANYQNRAQTASALTTVVSEWKTQLAVFATMTTENAAAALLGAVQQLTEKSVKENADLFETLVDSIAMRSAKGTYNLRQIIDAQGQMVAKLSTVGDKVEADFTRLAADKEALQKSSTFFRESVAKTYSKGGMLMGTSTPERPVTLAGGSSPEARLTAGSGQ